MANFALIAVLATAPDSQADAQLTSMLSEIREEMTDEEVKTALFKAIDLSVRYSWASSFVQTAMVLEWESLGGKASDPAPWRAHEL